MPQLRMSWSGFIAMARRRTIGLPALTAARFLSQKKPDGGLLLPFWLFRMHLTRLANSFATTTQQPEHQRANGSRCGERNSRFCLGLQRF
jgi:hypothetical protein